jgi:hypothetical protein
MKRSQQLIGLGGAVIGVGTGLWGAVRRTAGAAESLYPAELRERVLAAESR